ncbi:MAG: YraN family protein [Alphaproteobacteria bacterium]
MTRKRAPDPLRLQAELRGRKGEIWAAIVLALKGYRVLGRRVRTHAGELDLVARAPSGVLCFVEVKARPDWDTAVLAVAPRQRERIARAAALYVGARPRLRHNGVRFDAILIAPGKWPRHMKDVWRPD